MDGEEASKEGGWLRIPDGRTFAELTVAEKGPCSYVMEAFEDVFVLRTVFTQSMAWFDACLPACLP